MLCGSGMNVIAEIKSGNQDVIFAGGVENMSASPYLIPAKARDGLGCFSRELSPKV